MIKPFQSIFKTTSIQYRVFFMHPKAVSILCEMAVWAWDNGCPFVITETATTLSEDTVLKRVSSSHREGRAFDVSTRDWKEEKIKSFMGFFIAKYGHLGAIAAGTMKTALIVRHDTGAGDHMHVQLNKNFGNAEVVTKGEKLP